MKIEEIRQYLLNNSRYFSSKNDIEITDIKSQNKYYFVGDCGHEFLSLPTNVFVKEKLHCPVCAGRIVQRGVNDLWTTHKHLAEMLVNKEDGYCYSIGSNKKLEWVCPDCGNISYKIPYKMNENISYCQKCSKLNSYGENFVTELLNQLCETFDKEKIFEWSNGKRYDFYLPYFNCIIEVHGKQHYLSSDFSGFGGKTYLEEQLNDQYKRDLALQNGVKHYVVIENIRSEKDYLSNNILKSMLPTILNFTRKDIDWDKCHEACITSKTKRICEYYEDNNKNLNVIAEHFGCCYNTVRKHLKDGALIGLCSYSPEESIIEARNKSVTRMISNMSKPIMQFDMDGNYIKEYESIQSAQRELKISHIWDCLVGKRKSAGGYKWKYKEV